MATSPFFNNFSSPREQALIEDLVIESIKIYGIDNYYIPRKIVTLNTTFREQEFTEFVGAINIEMYIKNVDGFDGEGEFLSSFGVEVREQITFSIALRVFEQEASYILKRDRPLEGDLIWFPFTQALYTIKYVNKKPIFYQMGALQFYDITCELFEYSNEIFNTGIDYIDQTYNSFLTTTDPYFLKTETNTILTDENNNPLILEAYNIDLLDSVAQNGIFEEEGSNFLDFSQTDPFSETGRV
jgi:Virus neck protein